MEFRSQLEYSNDPRFIDKVVKNNGYNNAYYLNRKEEIIRHGTFISHSNKLNGFGTLTKYSNNINIMIGYFLDDTPIDSYISIQSKMPHLYTDKKTAYCYAIQCDMSTNKQTVKRKNKKLIYLQLTLCDNVPQKIKIIKEPVYTLAIRCLNASVPG